MSNQASPKKEDPPYSEADSEDQATPPSSDGCEPDRSSSADFIATLQASVNRRCADF